MFQCYDGQTKYYTVQLTDVHSITSALMKFAECNVGIPRSLHFPKLKAFLLNQICVYL